jgi:hypothetical protein
MQPPSSSPPYALREGEKDIVLLGKGDATPFVAWGRPPQHYGEVYSSVCPFPRSYLQRKLPCRVVASNPPRRCAPSLRGGDFHRRSRKKLWNPSSQIPTKGLSLLRERIEHLGATSYPVARAANSWSGFPRKSHPTNKRSGVFSKNVRAKPDL